MARDAAAASTSPSGRRASSLASHSRRSLLPDEYYSGAPMGAHPGQRTLPTYRGWAERASSPSGGAGGRYVRASRASRSANAAQYPLGRAVLDADDVDAFSFDSGEECHDGGRDGRGEGGLAGGGTFSNAAELERLDRAVEAYADELHHRRSGMHRGGRPSRSELAHDAHQAAPGTPGSEGSGDSEAEDSPPPPPAQPGVPVVSLADLSPRLLAASGLYLGRSGLPAHYDHHWAEEQMAAAELHLMAMVEEQQLGHAQSRMPPELAAEQGSRVHSTSRYSARLRDANDEIARLAALAASGQAGDVEGQEGGEDDGHGHGRRDGAGRHGGGGADAVDRSGDDASSGGLDPDDESGGYALPSMQAPSATAQRLHERLGRARTGRRVREPAIGPTNDEGPLCRPTPCKPSGSALAATPSAASTSAPWQRPLETPEYEGEGGARASGRASCSPSAQVTESPSHSQSLCGCFDSPIDGGGAAGSSAGLGSGPSGGGSSARQGSGRTPLSTGGARTAAGAALAATAADDEEDDELAVHWADRAEADAEADGYYPPGAVFEGAVYPGICSPPRRKANPAAMARARRGRVSGEQSPIGGGGAVGGASASASEPASGFHTPVETMSGEEEGRHTTGHDEDDGGLISPGESQLYRSVDRVRRPSEPPSEEPSRTVSLVASRSASRAAHEPPTPARGARHHDEPPTLMQGGGGHTPASGGLTPAGGLTPGASGAATPLIDLSLVRSASEEAGAATNKPLLVSPPPSAGKRSGVAPSNPATKARIRGAGTSTPQSVTLAELRASSAPNSAAKLDDGLGPRAAALNWMAAQLIEDNESFCSVSSGRQGVTNTTRKGIREREQAAAKAALTPTPLLARIHASEGDGELGV